jgi:hypothetical protein
MGHFSMEIYAPNGSNLSGNQQTIAFMPCRTLAFILSSTKWIGM